MAGYQKPQLTALNRWVGLMDTEFRNHDELHLLGANATRSMEPLSSALAAFLLLAGMIPPRRRVMPARPSAPHRGPIGRVQLRFLGSLFCEGAIDDEVTRLGGVAFVKAAPLQQHLQVAQHARAAADHHALMR